MVSDRFWSAQSAFWNSRPAAQKKAERLKISDPVGQRIFNRLNDGSQWVAKAGQPGIVRIDPQLRIDMLQLIRDLAPMLVDAFDRRLGALAFDAWRKWPTKTGLSKSMIELRYDTEQAATVLRGQIISRAPYTPYIDGNPFRRLIDSQGIPAATAITQDVALEVRRHE